MNYEEFCAALQEELFNRLDTDYSIHRERVLKNNGVVLDSLALLRSGKHCSPVISLEMLYEQFEKGRTLPELCEYMISVTDTELPLSVTNLTSLNDFEEFRDRIVWRLISRDKNEELLKTVPWLPYLDLAVVFSLVIQSEGETQISSLVTNAVSASWHAAAEELFALARENTPRIFPASFRRLESVIEEYFPGATDFVPEDCPVPTLYVLTNDFAHHGAACVLYPDKLKDLADRFGSDLLVLPSSIHEVLIIADSETFTEHDYQVFCNTIKNVNRESIQPEDFLSDNMYQYCRESGRLQIFNSVSPDFPHDRDAQDSQRNP